MTFDARQIKLMEPGAYLTSHEYPGLRIEATKDRRTWIYRYRSPIDASKLRQMKIGNWPEVSLHVAISRWEELKKRRDAGEDPALESKLKKASERQAKQDEERQLVAGRVTIYDVAMNYLDGHVVVNRKTGGANIVRGMFERMLGETGKLPAADLSRSDAFALIRSHSEDRPTLAKRLRCELGAAWEYAYDSGKLPETAPNWWRMITRIKAKAKGRKMGGVASERKKRVLSNDEINALVNWFPNLSSTISDVLALYLWTCCRGNEIVQMEGREIVEESDGHWWVLPKEKTKNSRLENAYDLRVPLTGRALEICLRRKEIHGSGHLFPARNGSHILQSTVQSSIYMLQPYSKNGQARNLTKLPVTHWAPHDLRRTSRTLLASMGCPEEIAEAMLGHMRPGIVGVYNLHSYDKERRDWGTRLSMRLEEIVNPGAGAQCLAVGEDQK